jgi:hypothetical protein
MSFTGRSRRKIAEWIVERGKQIGAFARKLDTGRKVSGLRVFLFGVEGSGCFWSGAFLPKLRDNRIRHLRLFVCLAYARLSLSFLALQPPITQACPSSLQHLLATEQTPLCSFTFGISGIIGFFAEN